MPALIRDIETKSKLNLTKVGVHRYAVDPSTEILCMAYCVDDDPIKLWHDGDPVPPEFKEAARNPKWRAVAHNAAFEMAIERGIVGPRHKFPLIPVERNICTMTEALAMALPGKLELCAKAIGIEERKDKAGRRAMLQTTKPRRARKSEDPEDVHWYDDETRLELVDQYCMQDVALEREVFNAIRPMPQDEYELWLLDQRINNRGFYIDYKLALAANKIVDETFPLLDKELCDLTEGTVQTVNQVAQMRAWLSEHCRIIADDLDKETVEILLTNTKDDKARRLLELRQLGAHASVKKVNAFLTRRCTDGRVRGEFQFHKAGTGRWASSGTQVHNLKRLPDDFDYDAAIKVIVKGDRALAAKTYPQPLKMIGTLMRPMIVAVKDHELWGADFSGIEARVTAWLAGQEDKLEVFRQYDAGKGPDPYIVTASKILKKLVEQITKAERQKYGKTCLGADTLVLTHRGFKRIVDVTTIDLLWDGESWVKHQGLLDQGIRTVMQMNGVIITPDHPIKVGANWISAQTVASNENILSQALTTASENLPWLDMRIENKAAVLTFLHNVPVELNHAKSQSIIYEMENPRDVMHVLKNKLDFGEKVSGLTPTLFRTTSIVAGYSTVSQPALTDVPILTINAITIMVDAVFQYIRFGWMIVERFLNMWSHLMAGIIQNLNWIVSTTIKATSPEISNFRHEEKILITNVLSKRCKNTSQNLKPVYDIANAGPHNRFMILTEAGPLIVHNCELAFGFAGSVGAFRKFSSDDDFSDEEIIVFRDTWREAHSKIRKYWYALNDCFWDAMNNPNTTYTANRKTSVIYDPDTFCMPFIWLTLPSGRQLAYPDIRKRKPTRVEENNGFTTRGIYFKDNTQGRWRDVRVWPGLITENVVQAVARDLLAEALKRLDTAGFKIVTHTHDEVVCEERKNSNRFEQFTEIMNTVPEWATGMPIVAKGWRDIRYTK